MTTHPKPALVEQATYPMAVMSPPAPTQAAGPRKLTLRNYLAYAAGDAANNLSFTMAGMFLILYYTNVVGVEGAVIGTMFLVVRFIDAFTDLLVGRAVDAKRPGKLGKFKPFILWFSLPLLLSSMAIYSAKTFFPDISGGAAVAYMYATYILMASVFYTLVNIPYGSMAPALTQVPVERGKLAAFRGYGAALSILALAFIIAPQIRANVGDPEALQRSLFITTALFVVVGTALYLFLVVNTKEQVARPAAPVSLKDSLRTLTTNKPLLWLSLGAVLFLTGMTAFSTLAPTSPSTSSRTPSSSRGTHSPRRPRSSWSDRSSRPSCARSASAPATSSSAASPSSARRSSPSRH